MNPYVRNVNKIEFVVTDVCSGRCRHCSQGEHPASGVFLDPEKAAEVVRRVASVYDVKTVMTFGGEPLFNPDAVLSVMDMAKKLDICKRQVITNGYFSKDKDYISDICKRLYVSGVNDLLVSVDAFHQETIPVDTVRAFVTVSLQNGLSPVIQPAWLISPTHDNSYNVRTRELIDIFSNMGLVVNEGNIIFPEGNALKYLSEYFTDMAAENPYAENPYDIKTISVAADGTVLSGNIYEKDILDIIRDYTP